MRFTILALLALAYVAHAQKAGTNTAESHLDMPMQESGSSLSTSIVLDSNWRWTHHVDDYVNCYDGNEWSTEFCPDSATCTENCAIDGVDQGTWGGTYGISASGGGITLKFVTEGTYSTNIGSRVYLLASEDKYKMFYLKNREFSVDIDAS
ncbi:hypothetical protein GUF81_25115, partial [Xanthomonas citri pv. citri]|nr:hypothetical protein [Xanthomonas citri pv. citri]